MRSAGVLLLVGSLMVLPACSGEEPPRAAPSSATDGLGSERTGSTDATGAQLTVPRAVHKATVLRDGRVLVTGGCTLPGCEGFERAQNGEVYDPASGVFTSIGRMRSPRAGHSATLLRDGRVLLVGGYPGEGRPALRTAEVYDPRSGRFRALGDDMPVGRADHSATLMADGRVLVAGGTSDNRGTLDSTVLFDPRSHRFRHGPPLTSGRTGHAAVLVGDRVVLVGGTADLDSALATTDVLSGSRWAAGPALTEPRTKHAAVALADGSVLVVGGSHDVEGRALLSSTEVMRIGQPRAVRGPDLAEGQYKLDGAVTLLADGRVVIGGGRRVEVYDPADDTMTLVDAPAVPRRSFVSVSAVAPSEVLIAGGYDSAITPTAEARVIRIP